jgi:UDP-N-acetylglucosamine 4,6-dehydratase/5-epimerase
LNSTIDLFKGKDALKHLYFMRKKILVTGGTGFLGRNLALALKDDYDVVLTGRNNKQNMHAAEVTGCAVLPMDVANIEAVRDTFVETKPDIVIHAAATKFVDLAEKQPMECVDVNVVGSQNVARVAVEKAVESVLAISTDKAAPPVRNTYGLSKAIMERIFCSMDGKSDTKFACVRYGNVAWSTGSVLPIWKKMFDETGVIRSTGPEMRRFFFSVDEAVRLVTTAMENIEGIRGGVLSRYMKAAQIQDILDTWTRHKGGRWEKMEGRPGERNDEFLIGDIELPFTTEMDLNGVPHYFITFNSKAEKALERGLSSANTERLSEQEILALIDSPRD